MRQEHDRLTMHHLPENDRPRERLLHLGEHALSTTELLAITLRTGTGEENALRLAGRVLAHFQGLPGLAQATIAELTRVKGMGQVKAVEIKAALELGRRLSMAAPEEHPQVSSPAEAANLLMPEMMFLEQEQLRVILLNTRNHVIDIPTIYMGSLNSAAIRIGEVFRPAVKANAAAIIVAHNHPSGDPSPSPEDQQVTKELIRAGELLNIEVLDHLIIGRQQYVSLKERGLGGLWDA